MNCNHSGDVLIDVWHTKLINNRATVMERRSSEVHSHCAVSCDMEMQYPDFDINECFAQTFELFVVT